MTEEYVYRSKENALRDIFGKTPVVIGVVHLRALPGSPQYRGNSLEEIYGLAVEEAGRYARGGVHGLIVENHGDIPFSKPEDLGPETAAVMAVAADRIKQQVDLPIGINVLANGAITALAVAQAGRGRFVRINQWANAYVANEGIIEGPAARAARYRSFLHAHDIKVFADVHVKHGSHAIVADRSITELTRDAEFFDADVVIATGQRTGDSTKLDELRTIKKSTQLPVLVGSGVTEENVAELLTLADGVIVASSLKQEGVWWTPVSEDKVRSFMKVVNSL
ncbi:MAG: BtpA/SgcQ family protein [Trueperaceae bacterium]|nr:MAG: BtpA/SgcQ family protein [Trueperaceae bacterium]